MVRPPEQRDVLHFTHAPQEKWVCCMAMHLGNDWAEGARLLLCRYGCTKWACEVLLKQLHEQYQVPVQIFRCSMILAHTQ